MNPKNCRSTLFLVVLTILSCWEPLFSRPKQGISSSADSVAGVAPVKSRRNDTRSLQQSSLTSERFEVKPDRDTLLRLSHSFLLVGSERVFADSIRLQGSEYYELDYRSGNLFVKSRRPPVKTSEHISILIVYKYLPFTFREYYRHRELLVRTDSITKQKTVAVQSSPLFNLDDAFGGNMQKSGSIFRGFTVGTNRDMSLNSGFRLQFAGKLSDDVDIVAALTDENSPLQPEGNTQTLQEIDNVFVQVKSQNYSATLGDFYFDLGGGEFSKTNRKLQGAEGGFKFEGTSLSGSGTVAAATARGKFANQQFAGLEAVQGPYRLYGKNNERNIIVIAGTDRVFLNGELLVRGESNDYSIDYGASEITFSTKRLITSASRIAVDFEYSDRNFTRNFTAVQSKTQLFANTTEFTVTYLREGDDPEAPIDISLTDGDKDLLKKGGAAGATKPGSTYVGIDSSTGLGKGSYVLSDTVISGDSLTFFMYAPYTPLSLYTVSFSYVGDGMGDYIRKTLGNYLYVGKGGGQYLPIVILPVPQLTQLADVRAMIHPSKALEIDAEAAGSSFNANRFVPDGSATLSGGAINLKTVYAPKDIRLGSASFGDLQLSLSERYVDENFSPLDRIDDVEFARRWSLDSTVKVQSSSEEIRDASIQYIPVHALIMSGSYGTNDRGKQFSAERKSFSAGFRADSLPTAEYSVESVDNNDYLSATQSSWLRQKAVGSYRWQVFEPGILFEQENRQITNRLTDSLIDGSFGFTSIAPRLLAKDIAGLTLSSSFEWRNDDAFWQGTVKRQSHSLTQSYGADVKETHSFSSSFLVTMRDKTYENEFRRVNGDIQTILVRAQSKYAPFKRGVDADLYYEVGTERSAKLERVFYQVKKGEGQYVWTDANGDGKVDLTDEREFTLSRFDGDYILLSLPSDQLYPVINLKTSARLRLTPSRFLSAPDTWVERAMQKISTESFVRVEEQSSESDLAQIYLLHFDKFLRPQTTIQGRQTFQQDLFLFETDQLFSFRFRLLQQKGLGQYSTGTETSYGRDRSVRMRFQPGTDFSNQTEYTNKEDDVTAPAVSSRSRRIQSDDITSDWSYRPEQNLELGFVLELSRSEDHVTATPTAANFNSQSLRLVQSFQGFGQLRIDASREEIALENVTSILTIPYELTGGRNQGKTFLWSASFDYKISSNVQSSVQYSGRSEPGSRIVHTGRAEVRAFF